MYTQNAATINGTCAANCFHAAAAQTTRISDGPEDPLVSGTKSAFDGVIAALRRLISLSAIWGG